MQNQTESSSMTNRPMLSSPLVEVATTVHVPRSRAFQGWRDPEIIKEWWGPEGFTCPVAKTDFRVGGKYLFEMKKDDMDLWTTGSYKEILDDERIVYSDWPSNSKGDIVTPGEAGMEAFRDMGATIVTVEFIERGFQTEVRVTHAGIPEDQHDNCVEGWASSLDKFVRAVERH